MGLGMYGAILSEDKKEKAFIPFQLKKVKITKAVKELQRFQEFASLSIGEEFFMTPRDFLDAMIMDRPRPRMRRKKLSPEKAEK